MDAISAARLTQIHPETARRLTNIIEALNAEGATASPPYSMRVTRGIATIAQQNALWQLGRDAAGNVVDRAKVVTKAKGMQSNHVMGFAADTCVMVDGTPVWDAKHPGYTRQIALAPTFGLRSGAAWGDKPHLENQDFSTEPTEAMQVAYMRAGAPAVWAAISSPPSPA